MFELVGRTPDATGATPGTSDEGGAELSGGWVVEGWGAGGWVVEGWVVGGATLFCGTVVDTPAVWSVGSGEAAINQALST